MAQIIKFAEGGSTEVPKPKYGKFTINGTTYDVDDDFLNQLHAVGSNLDDKSAAQFSKIEQSLRNGNDLSYDSNANTLEGTVDWDVTDKQKDRLSRSRTNAGKWFGNTWRGQENAARLAVNALRNFNYTKPTVQVDPVEHDWSKTYEFEFEKDKKGNYVLDNNKNKKYLQSAGNLEAVKRLQQIGDIAGYGEKDIFKGYNGHDRDFYTNWYNGFGKENLDALIGRIQAGKWTAQDEQTLDDLGFFLSPRTTSTSSGTGASSQTDSTGALTPEAQKQKLKERGWGDRAHEFFNIDKDNNVTLKDQGLIDRVGTGNAWLNKDFLKYNGAYRDIVPENGGLFVINGKVYRGNDFDSLNRQQDYLDFVSANRRSGGNAATMKQYWNPDSEEYSGWDDLSRDAEGKEVYGPAFQAGDWGRDVSGEYVRGANDPLIYRVLSNYASNNESMTDAYGRPLEDNSQLVFIDPVTKKRVTRSQEWINGLRKNENPTQVAEYYNNVNRPTAFSKYIQLGNNNVAEVQRIADPMNDSAGVTLYKDPKTGKYFFMADSENYGNYSIGGQSMKDYIWSLDPRLGKYFEEHPEALNETSNVQAVMSAIRNPLLGLGLFRDKYSDEIANENYSDLQALLKELNTNGIYLGDKRYTPSQLSSMRSNPGSWLNFGLAYRRPSSIPSQKNGGVLKMESGGVSRNRQASQRASETAIKQSNETLRSSGQGKVIGDGSKLTGADWAEIGALLGDTAALGMTFVPGVGNVAAAGVGAAATTANLASGIARDGLDWGDVGNALLGYGLDVATVIPGLGSAAKGAKLAKALQKSSAIAKGVKYAMMGMGATAAADALGTAYNRIQDGQWTISDLRTVVNGIRGLQGMRHMRGKTKTGVTEGDTATLKSANSALGEVKIAKSEIDAIKNAEPGQRVTMMENLIKSKLPEGQAIPEGVDLLSNYGISKSSAKNGVFNKMKFWKDGEPTIDTKQIKMDTKESEYINPETASWWNRRAAETSAKTDPNNPYFKFNPKTQAKIDALNKKLVDTKAHQAEVTNQMTAKQQGFDEATAAQNAGQNINTAQQNLINEYNTLKNESDALAQNVPQMEAYYNTTRQRLLNAYGRKDLSGRVTHPIWGGISNPLFNMYRRVNQPEPRKFYDEENRPMFYKDGGKIHIDPSKEGTFTKAAQERGLGVQEFANKVLAHPENYSEAMRKKAQFAHNAKSWNKNGGILYAKDGSQITSGQSDKIKKPGNFYVNPDFGYAVADLLGSTYASNAMNNRMAEGIKQGMIGSQRSMPTEYYPTFTDNGLERMYDDRMNQMRHSKTVTSDAKLAAMDRLQRDQQIDAMDSEKKTKLSQLIGQHNAAMLATKQNYANMRTQIADENKKNWYSGKAQLAMNDANRIAALAQSGKLFLSEMRQNLAKDRLERKQAQQYAKQYQNNINFDKAIQEKYNKQFNALSDADKRKYGSVGAMAQQLDPTGYSALQSKHYINAMIDDYNSGDSYSPFGRKRIQPFKNGGTIKRHRDVNEQVLLDNNKAVNKAIGDLNNNIIRLFNKMMS